jgi:hypothetical protein
MFGDTRKELLEKGKITDKAAKGKVGTDIAGKYVRKEVFEAKNIDFYDATSSVTAHIGAMTGDRKSLEMSKLLPTSGKPPHHDLAMSLGVKPDATAKPYFSVLYGSKGSLTSKDFQGMEKGKIKEIVKDIWTPGSYGSKPSFGGYNSMGVKTAKALEKAGLSPELAKATSQKMLNNFKETTLAQFSPGFVKIVREAPENFVYENPLSGSRLSFNKHNQEQVRIRLTGSDGKPVQVRALVPTSVNSRKTRSGAAALFVQNWDSAVMSDLMLKQRSPHTVHDAIGVKKSMVGRLNVNVAKSMSTVQKMKPLEDLSKQIMAQHKKNGANAAFLAKTQKDLDLALKEIRKSNEQFTFKPETGHFVLE